MDVVSTSGASSTSATGGETVCISTEKQKADEQNYKLIAASNEAFDAKNYDKCLEIIDQLLSSKYYNKCKLRHNRAVVEYYKSDCIEHGKLLKELLELQNEAKRNKQELQPIVRYNLAIIFFHRHMYRTATEMLSPLLENLDKEEQNLKVLVATLMLQLLLSTNQRNKAQAFLKTLQTKMFLNDVTSDVLEPVVADDVATTSEGIVSGGVGSSSTTVALPSSKATKATHGESVDRHFKLLSLLTNVLNRKIVVIPEDGSTEYAALKAHQYYIMKDFQMAAKQLQKIVQDPNNANNQELNTCIANNMGVIHMRVRHYAIAASFFQKGIIFDKHVANAIQTTSLHRLSKAHTCEILYNLGISMLYLRRPQDAFQCFLMPLKTYHSNPRLWFRMAEACIMDFDIQRKEEEKKPLVQVVPIGDGTQKRFVMKPPQRIKYSNTQSAAVPELNLEFATLCLRNALSLTKYYKRNFHVNSTESSPSSSTAEEPENWREARDNNFCNPSRPVSKESIDQLLCAIYAASSFVALRLGDYVMALEMAQELLKSETLSDAHKMLGHMYAGEALIKMDRFPEAHPHLEPTFVSSLNAFDFETKDWQVKSLDAAQNIVRYNLAVALALQGNYEMAKGVVSTLTHPIVAPKAMSLRVFLELRTGGLN